VQRSSGDAKHRPVTLLRRAGTHERALRDWASDQQRTAARCAASGARNKLSPQRMLVALNVEELRLAGPSPA
jgi:hypothetical protein